MMMGAAQVAPAPLLCQLGDACRSKDATRGKRLKAGALTNWRAGLRQDICAKCPALDEKRRAVAEDWGAPKDLPFTASICRTCEGGMWEMWGVRSGVT